MANINTVNFKIPDFLRSYGRNRTKYISDYQQKLLRDVLPDYQIMIDDKKPINIAELFARPYDDYALEIGFGNGEHLAMLAKKYPNRGFIGVEPYINGVAKLLKMMEEQQLSNIRILNDDVRHLLPLLSTEIFTQIIILHPDPWPRKKHHKRRLLQPSFLQRISDLLTPQGRLLIGTDCTSYMQWILLLVLKNATLRWQATEKKDWQTPPEIMTYYAGKAQKKGQERWYFHMKK